MFIIPVPFSKYYKEMLAHCKELMEYQNGYVAIHPRYNKLITALRTAVENPFTSQISKSIQPSYH